MNRLQKIFYSAWATNFIGVLIGVFGFLLSVFAVWDFTKGSDGGGPMHMYLAPYIDLPAFVMGIGAVILCAWLLKYSLAKLQVTLALMMMCAATWNIFWTPPFDDGAWHMLRASKFYSPFPAEAWEFALAFGLAAYIFFLGLHPYIIHPEKQAKEERHGLVFFLSRLGINFLVSILIAGTVWIFPLSTTFASADSVTINQRIAYVTLVALSFLTIVWFRQKRFRASAVGLLFTIYSGLNALLFIFMVVLYKLV